MTGWNQKFLPLAALAAALLLLAGCGGAEGAPLTPAPSASSGVESGAPTPAPSVSSSAEETPTPSLPPLLLPQADGERREENDKAAVDLSHTEDGYIMARRVGQGKRMKLRLAKGEREYTYDLTGEEWTALPLSEGSGGYTAAIYENVEGTAYAAVLTVSFDAALSSEFAPFLRPNQQVDYAGAPLTLAKAAELVQGAEGPEEKTERIYAFVTGALEYDGELAETVESGYISSPDEALEKGKGICLDFAVLMTSMLRSQGVPCKLVVGDAGKVYHAWTQVWDGEEWTRMDPTFAASGADTAGVEYVPKFYY